MPEQPFRIPELGDGEIQRQHRDNMKAIAQSLDQIFNGAKAGNVKERTWGFVVLVFPFGDDTGRANMISNGADRRDLIKLFRETANRFEADLKPKVR